MDIETIKAKHAHCVQQLRERIQRRAEFERMLAANERDIAALEGAVGVLEELLRSSEQPETERSAG